MALPPIETELTAHGEPDLTSAPSGKVHGRSPMRIAMDRLRADKVAVVSAAIVLIFILIAIFAPLLCKLFGVELQAGSGSELDGLSMPLVGPPYEDFTWDHPLGIAPRTAHDNLAQWFYGARTSMFIAIVSTLLATIVGIVVGLVAGFSRGWADRVISWIIDFFLSLPFLLVALSLAPIIIVRFRENEASLERAQLIALLFVLSAFGWMSLARLIRGEVLSLREREFIQAARVIGVPTRVILFKELLPNLVAPIVVSVSLGLPAFVSAEAALAFLGVGVVGIPSWGQTIDNATAYFDAYPMYLWPPVLGVLLLVLALNLLGDSVRDAFDPKTRR
jgi:ABC-type dipeptide/oligopeptide/nickel transport system permease subunit